MFYAFVGFAPPDTEVNLFVLGRPALINLTLVSLDETLDRYHPQPFSPTSFVPRRRPPTVQEKFASRDDSEMTSDTLSGAAAIDPTLPESPHRPDIVTATKGDLADASYTASSVNQGHPSHSFVSNEGPREVTSLNSSLPLNAQIFHSHAPTFTNREVLLGTVMRHEDSGARFGSSDVLELPPEYSQA